MLVNDPFKDSEGSIMDKDEMIMQNFERVVHELEAETMKAAQILRPLSS